VVHAASCEQAPPQSVKDRATYTPAELARYGLPPRTADEPFDKWAKIVRAAGKRVCDYTVGTGHWGYFYNSIWGGYVADESSPGQNYTEADMDYYVPCITGTPPSPAGSAVMGAWIGLGGNTGVPLVQAGTVDFQNWDPIHGYQNLYQAFVENTGTDVQNPDPPRYFFTMSCPTHIYVKVWGGDCMYVLDINNGVNTGDQCYGVSADNQSAEAIVERNKNVVDYPYFTDFSSATFHGVGITDNSSYKAMNQVPHDYTEPRDCLAAHGSCSRTSLTGWGNPLETVGSIQNDPNDVPYDQYTVTWKLYS
jgi:hypothetical protein